jgi:cytochrome c-type biogenesis protein CcmE
MEQPQQIQPPQTSKLKFIIGGLLIVAAIAYLIVSSSQANAQYYYTVNEVLSQSDRLAGKQLRISGAVIGDTIVYDPQALTLSFDVVHISGDNNEIEKQGGLALVLHAAVINPDLKRLKVIYNGPRPDLLQNEAQAIMTGTLDEQGVFHADELLLKCPSRYEEELPKQAEG